MANEENNFENDDISRLLGSLKQAEPPADFDVRVRARIAQGRTTVRHSWFPVPARLAVAMAIVLTGGYLGFRSFQSPAAEQQAGLVPMPQAPAQVVADQRPPANERELVQPAEKPAKDTLALNPSQHDEATSTGNIAAADRRKTREATRGGGSTDVAVGIPKVITPKGVNTPLDPSPKEFFSGMGAEMDHSGTAWKVTEIKPNSLAEKSGLKAGDVVEALNKKGSSKKTPTVRVRRDGKTLEITLQP